ncbi:A/G-specific adenine glycosylase [Dehalobacter sp. DCM]|uniref:A/G-specific adenine glycosylase n=1 Tax=Dehalobacter sp. DCM TaxID=2907827 RepID=UPI0030814D99|nr:A/G-specific adenine glycosylase [Dehalobacter sp. DCM]
MQNSQYLSAALLTWYAQNRRELPWRNTSDPYAIWISEIMLQQTQVETVIDYYHRFLNGFPDVARLGQAEEEDVLSLWKGLGYYTRARNILRAARVILEKFDGVFPTVYTDIRSLPGIGDYTAGAIASIAYNLSYPAVDGNVLRIISRLDGIEEDISLQKTKTRITARAAGLIPDGKAGDFNQALMDLGATVCVPKDPKCTVSCPWQTECSAHRDGKESILPIKKKAKKPIEYHYAAAVIRRNADILMTKRQADALLANMWGLPLVCLESGISPETRFGHEWGLEVTNTVYLGHVKHVFSHQIWQIDVYSMTLNDESQVDGDHNDRPLAWVSPERLKTLPVPKAFQKVLSLGSFF